MTEKVEPNEDSALCDAVAAVNSDSGAIVNRRNSERWGKRRKGFSKALALNGRVIRGEVQQRT